MIANATYKQLKKGILFLLFIVATISSHAQFENQIPKPIKYDPAAVIDSTYGIAMYKKLIFYLGGDSVRSDKKGYVCNGWIEDHYQNGKLLHKGFYVDGYLKIYKNYYENGNLERSFENKAGDDTRGVLKTYFPNGNIKSFIIYEKRLPVASTLYFSNGNIRSQIVYSGKNPLKWQDYYDNGQLQMESEYNETFEYLIKNINYYNNGKRQYQIELIDTKALRYKRTDFTKEEKVKEKGELIFDKESNDYLKNGKWTSYDKDGKVSNEHTYQRGKLVN